MHTTHYRGAWILPLVVVAVAGVIFAVALYGNALPTGMSVYFGNNTVTEWPTILTPVNGTSNEMSTFILAEELSRYTLAHASRSAGVAPAATYSPNVIRTVQNVYGVLEGWTYKAYDITGTIAVCVNIEYVPRNMTFAVALYDEDTKTALWFYWNGTGEVSGFCPATDDGNDGFEQIRFANIYPPYYNIYIAYSGTLSRYYW